MDFDLKRCLVPKKPSVKEANEWEISIAEINKMSERFNAIIKNRQSTGKDATTQPEQPTGETI